MSNKEGRESCFLLWQKNEWEERDRENCGEKQREQGKRWKMLGKTNKDGSRHLALNDALKDRIQEPWESPSVKENTCRADGVAWEEVAAGHRYDLYKKNAPNKRRHMSATHPERKSG